MPGPFAREFIGVPIHSRGWCSQNEGAAGGETGQRCEVSLVSRPRTP